MTARPGVVFVLEEEKLGSPVVRTELGGVCVCPVKRSSFLVDSSLSTPRTLEGRSGPRAGYFFRLVGAAA